jgi:hypothetical protein
MVSANESGTCQSIERTIGQVSAPACMRRCDAPSAPIEVGIANRQAAACCPGKILPGRYYTRWHSAKRRRRRSITRRWNTSRRPVEHFVATSVERFNDRITRCSSTAGGRGTQVVGCAYTDGPLTDSSFTVEMQPARVVK